MSAFCVFGVTNLAAHAKAVKKVKTVAKGGVMKPVHEYEQELAETAESLFETMKPLQVSPAFDAPQFANDWAAVAARTVRCRALQIMVRAPKTDKADNIVKSKRTGRPVMVWKPYNVSMLQAAA